MKKRHIHRQQKFNSGWVMDTEVPNLGLYWALAIAVAWANLSGMRLEEMTAL